ncbi:hypothetical protein DFH28DRAFT_887816, partial [Melampsora americana]
NFQHNCHDGNCAILQTKTQMVERQVIRQKGWEDNHSEHNSYILNSSSFDSSQVHCEMAGFEVEDVTPEEWCSDEFCCNQSKEGQGRPTNSQMPPLISSDPQRSPPQYSSP